MVNATAIRPMIFVATSALLLAGCAVPPAPPPASRGEPAQPAPAQPRDGGILHSFSWSSPRSLDYCKESSSAFAAERWAPVFEGLLSFDYKVGEDFRKEMRTVPYLAERWEQPDDSTYVFSLRKGVKWQDGEPFTADDVVFSFGYIPDKANACTKAPGNLKGLKSIEKVDATTLKVTTDGPMAPFLENLAQRETVIYPKHIFDQGKLFKSAESQIGTGPARVLSFEPDGKTVYQSNPGHWRTKPHIDGLVIFTIPERQQRVAAFAGKQIDLLTVSDKVQYESAMAQVPDAIGVGFPTTHGFAVYMRVDRPPLNDVRVRRAIHLALNRQDMAKTLAFGLGRINPPGVSAVTPWAIPEEELLKLPGYRLPKDQDLAEAKRLLAEAGYPQGLDLSIQAVSVWDNPKIAEVAARQLQEVGINIKLDFIESGIYFGNQAKGDYQIQLNGMSSDTIDGSLSNYFYSKAGGNPARVADPELDRLIELQRRTLKRDERFKVLRQIQEHLLDKLYMVPTVELAFFWINQPYVHDVPDVRSTSIVLVRLADAWLDDRVPAGRSLR